MASTFVPLNGVTFTLNGSTIGQVISISGGGVTTRRVDITNADSQNVTEYGVLRLDYEPLRVRCRWNGTTLGPSTWANLKGAVPFTINFPSGGGTDITGNAIVDVSNSISIATDGTAEIEFTLQPVHSVS